MNTCTNTITFQSLIFAFITEHKFLFVCYLLFVLVIPLQEIGVPHIIGKLTKNIQDKTSIIIPLVMLVIVMCIIQGARLASGLIEVRLYPIFQKFIRDKIVNYIMKEMKTNYEELHTGEITMHLHKFPLTLYSYFEDLRNIIIPQFLVYVIAIAYFSYYDIYIGLGLLLTIVIVLFSIKYTVNRCLIISKDRDTNYNIMMEEITDLFKNSTSVLNANSETRETKRSNIKQGIYYENMRKSLTCAYDTMYILIPFVLILFALLLYRIYLNVKSGNIASFNMVSLVMILLYIMRSILVLVDNLKDQVFKWGSIQVSLDLINQCAPQEKSPIAMHNDLVDGFVLKDVSYGYKNRKPIFDHLNLVIKPKKITLIVGEIGSGKTTLIKLLLKYKIPTEGTIYYNKRPYNTINVEELRTIIGYVPQTPILFNRTIYENITYNKPSTSEDEVLELMKTLGVEDMIYKFPEGLQTNVGSGGSKLSGGQRQIVWIMRIILQDPEVIILDEPTSALDDDTKPVIQHMIETIIKNKTIIMISHDKYLYKFADTIIELKPN